MLIRYLSGCWLPVYLFIYFRILFLHQIHLILLLVENQERNFAVKGRKMYTTGNFMIYEHIPVRQSMRASLESIWLICIIKVT